MLRYLLPEDRTDVALLLTEAFRRPYEAQLVLALRDAGDMPLEMVYDSPNGIVGYVGFARHYAPKGWWSLSPVAVRPRLQGKGIGGDLVRYGLDEARQRKAQAVTVLGYPGFYSRFGFNRKAAENLRTPFDISNTLLYPIKPGTAGLAADLIYPPAFSRSDL